MVCSQLVTAESRGQVTEQKHGQEMRKLARHSSHGADADEVGMSGEGPVDLGVGLTSAGVRGDAPPLEVLWLRRGAEVAGFRVGPDPVSPTSAATTAQAEAARPRRQNTSNPSGG